MLLNLNGVNYEVNMEPLKQRALEAAAQLIQSDGNVVLKTAVKSACTMAMPMLGLEKKDRNDNPISIVVNHIMTKIFDDVDDRGLTIVGQLVEPDAPAVPEKTADSIAIGD
jgi:peroxiredoxin family protein